MLAHLFIALTLLALCVCI